MIRFFTWILALFMLACPCVFADPPIQIDAKPCFVGMSPGGTFPVVVSVRNMGASFDSTISVTCETYLDSQRTYLYPISLPSGTTKQIVVYPDIGYETQSLNIRLNTPSGKLETSVGTSGHGSDSQQIGLIGDQMGGLAGIIAFSPMANGKSAISDSYCRPEEAPDRATGYKSLATLVITDGAERMNSAQWSAIRRWVLTGGSCILLGGAGSAYLQTPDAQALVPLANLHGASVAQLQLSGFGNQTLPSGGVALTSGQIKPGAETLAQQEGHVLLATQHLGGGVVLFVAFNPLEKPFSGWAGGHNLWSNLQRRATPTVSGERLRQYLYQQSDYHGYGGYAGSSSAAVNPFRVQLPPASTIAWLFLVYFLLVIPITYVVLKRLKKLEWAWVTSPLLAVGFAYVIYLFTAELYLAGMSRRTSGIIFATAGQPEADFVGYSELFLPKGGSYKVDISNAETLEVSLNGSGYNQYGSNTRLQALETIDDGHAFAPDLQVTNLSFRRLYHTQPVTWNGSVTANLHPGPVSNLTGTIHNETGQVLHNASLTFVGRSAGVSVVSLGDIQPGETKAIPQQYSNYNNGFEMQTNMLFRDVLNQQTMTSQKTAILSAGVSGDSLGPTQIGKYVGTDSGVTLMVSVPVTQGGQ